MTDPLGAVASIQQMAGQLSGLGTQLSSAASSGNFGSVLSQVNAEMAAIADGGQPAAGATPGASTSVPGSGSTGVSAAFLGTSPAGGSQVVADAEKYLGVPYQWGGTNPSTGLDCSGLVQRVYADLGYQLPRTSQEQANVGTPVASLANAQPGDLVFFAGSDGTASSPGHVGIYIGNGMMIDAPHTGTDVQVQPVGQPVAIRRILPTGASSACGSALGSVVGSSLTGVGQNAAMNQLGVPAALQPLFEQAGSRYGIDPNLLAAVAKQESGFQVNAVSSAGAEGLMQLMPATAAGLGVSPLDPTQAIDGAAQMLSSYLGQYGGSVPLALAAYNAGPGAVSQYGGVPPYAETQNYVSSITSMLGAASPAGVLQ